MPYEAGPQDGPHQQGFLSCYFTGTASSGHMVEWRFNDGDISGSPPLGDASATEQGWYVEKTKLDPVMTAFAGVAWDKWNDRVLEADRPHVVITYGMCPELYVDTRALGAMPGSQVISGSPLVNAPAEFISGVSAGYAMPNIRAVAPAYSMAYPEPQMAIAMGRVNTNATGTIKAWVVRR